MLILVIGTNQTDGDDNNRVEWLIFPGIFCRRWLTSHHKHGKMDADSVYIIQGGPKK